MPDLDEQQDSKVLSLTEVNGQTVMKFQRAIKACDQKDFSITVSKQLEILHMQRDPLVSIAEFLLE